MVNQSVIDSSVNLEQLKDIEGYVVVVEMTGEMDATDAISDYLRKRTELMY